MSSTGAKWLKMSLGFAVAGGFVWLLARGLDVGELGRVFVGSSIPMLLFALVFLVTGWAIRIVRWWWMLRVLEPNLSPRACVWPFLMGMAVNNVLPFRAGDVLRAVGFRRQLRSPVMQVVGTLVIERILDLFVLLGIFFLGLFGLPDGVFPQDFVVALTWLAGLSIAAMLALVLFLPLLDRFLNRPSGNGFLANRRTSKAIFEHGAHLVEALGLVRSGPRMLVLVGLSVVAWACEGAVFVVVAAAVHTGATPWGPWFSLATGTLATSFPSSPGHIGTFDYFAAQGLAAYGASPEEAAAFALIVHAVLWAPLTVAGLFYLFLGRFHGRSRATFNPLRKKDALNR